MHFARLLTRRPAATLFAVRAGLNLAMAYGFHMTVEQMSSTLLFTEAVFSIFGDATTTPNVKLNPETVDAAKAGKLP
jgi:hypothetical protein